MRVAVVVLAIIIAGCAQTVDRPVMVPDNDQRVSRTSFHQLPPKAENPFDGGANVQPESPSRVSETPEQMCARTRAARVTEAKEAIKTLRERVTELRPARKWLVDHKCEFKDTQGSVRVIRSREKDGSVRIRTIYGRPDELVCTTPDVPEDISNVAHEVFLYENVDPNDYMFESSPVCDAIELPSLRVRHNDLAGQQAILSLP